MNRTLGGLWPGFVRLAHNIRTFFYRQPTVTLNGLALGFYLVFASIVTFPFAVDPANTLTAPNWGDVAASVSKYEGLRLSHGNPFTDTHIGYLAYPEGPLSNVGVDRASFFSVLYLWRTSKLVGAIPAHSLMTFLGYVLTAFVAFLFIRRVTGSWLAGLIAGFIYGFWPHMYTLARADMTYTHMWLFILPLWAFWSLITQNYTRRRLMLAALSVVPAVFWTPYYTLHVMVIGAACLLVALYYRLRQDGWRKALGMGTAVGGFWIMLLAVYAYIGLSAPAVFIPKRTMEDIYAQSASPVMFALPGMFSWGEDGNYILSKLIPSASGVNLYLGLSTLALASLALLSFQKRRRAEAFFRLSGPIKTLVIMAGTAATGCILFSLPPTYKIAGFKIPTPNYLVSHVVPALRAGQRFVMPLMASTAVLAGIGAWLILRRLEPRLRLCVAAVMMAVIGVDLWALPPEAAITIPRHASLAALRQLPAGPVAEFDNGNLVNQRLPCMYLHEYAKPLVNDCGLGRSHYLGRILDLPICDQIGALQAAGTRYVIVAPTDRIVHNCLTTRSAIERVAAKDNTYEVVVLKEATADDKAAWIAGP